MFENENVEFKREFSEGIIKTAVAFLNSQGGKILIGVDDDGNVIGLENTDDTLKKLSSSLKDGIEPDASLYYNINTEIIDEKIIVLIDVKKGGNRPYFLATKGIRPNGVLIRSGRTNVPAGLDKIKMLINSTRRFDEELSEEQNLTFEYFDKKLKDLGYEIDENKRISLGILNSNLKYTNLALLLSDQCKYNVKIGVFQGKDRRIFKDREEISGCIIKQIDDALKYLQFRNGLRARFYVGQGQRTDTYDYDPDALREGVINAILHRDYTCSGSVMINYFIDRIEILSIGGLPENITKEMMLNGASIPRNKMLCNLLYRLKYIEAYGNGIDKIISSYKGYNLEPKIEPINGAFLLTLPNRNYEEELVPKYLMEPTYEYGTNYSTSGGLSGKFSRKVHTLKENEENIYGKNMLILDTQKELIIKELQNKQYLTKEDVSTLLGVKTNRAYKILEEMLEMDLVVSNRLGKKKIYMRK